MTPGSVPATERHSPPTSAAPQSSSPASVASDGSVGPATKAGLPAAKVSDLERFNHGERGTYKCQRCAECTINATEMQLRVGGWRIWRGTTVGGTESAVVLCALCAGNAGTVGADGEVEGFDATCHTCGAQATDEEWDDPLTEADAKDWCRSHDCEPETEVIRPKGGVQVEADATRPTVEPVSAKAVYV